MALKEFGFTEDEIEEILRGEVVGYSGEKAEVETGSAILEADYIEMPLSDDLVEVGLVDEDYYILENLTRENLG